MEDRKFLGEERIGSLLFRLALPTVVAQLVNMLYNIVDRIYIGHIEGTGALALTGVGVCLPLILIVSAFAALISSGGGPRASIMMGHNDYAKAEQILGNSFTMQIIISAFLTVLLLLFNEKILLLFGASENTIGYATTYMNIYALGTVFVQITLGMNSFITAQGFAKTSMLSVVIGAITNIVLDPLFIFVFDMGVAGAAIATVISQAASTIWVMLFLTGKRTSLRIRRKYFRLDKAVCLSVLSLGLASFIMQASESVINICFNSNLLRYGGDLAVGAMTILSSVMQFAMLPLQGLGQGAQPIISYNFGAGLKNRVKSAFKYLLITDFTFSMLLFLLVHCSERLRAVLPGVCGERVSQHTYGHLRIPVFGEGAVQLGRARLVRRLSECELGVLGVDVYGVRPLPSGVRYEPEPRLLVARVVCVLAYGHAEDVGEARPVRHVAAFV